MRLLHTSDWHLGRQLHGVSLLEDQAHVLRQVVDIAREEAVDVVAIAGDVYDRAVPPAEAVALLGETLHSLCIELGCDVVLIAGNHDSGERLGFAADLLGAAGLHIAGPLDREPLRVPLQYRGQRCDLFALPYAGPTRVRHVLGDERVQSHEQAMQALLEQVEARRTEGRPTVVMAHCFVAGGQESDSERPLSLGGADRVSASLFAPYTYAALGHLHGAQQQGAAHIRYSGSILKYSFSEVAQRKSVTLVDIAGDGGVTITPRELEPLRELRVLEGSLEELLHAAGEDSRREDFIGVRLTDTQALLDIMGKLRRVYPNVLRAEIPHRQSTATPRGAGRALLRRGHRELFADFFQQVQGETMTPAQSEYLDEVLAALQEEGAL